MGVYFKRVKKPESCGKCFVGDRTICSNGCPMIELPEKHGRIIDADALEDNSITYYAVPIGRIRDGDPRLVISCQDLDNAPTIIEADNGRGKLTS